MKIWKSSCKILLNNKIRQEFFYNFEKYCRKPTFVIILLHNFVLILYKIAYLIQNCNKIIIDDYVFYSKVVVTVTANEFESDYYIYFYLGYYFQFCFSILSSLHF